MIRFMFPLRDFFVRNLRLKIISLVIAFFLWIALTSEPKSEVGFRVPLEFRNSPQHVEVLGDTVNSIDIRLSGISSLVKRIDVSDISASVDLSDWSLGERTYSITGANLRIPFGVNVTKITPNKIRLRFEETQQKPVEIRPRVVGKPAEGFQVDSMSCHPKETELAGAASHLARVQFIQTDSIDITGRSENFKGKVHLYVEDPLVRLAKDQETTVEVVILPRSMNALGGKR